MPYVESGLQLLANAGLPEIEVDLLTTAGWTADEMEVMRQGILDVGTELFADLELSAKGLRLISIIDAAASVRDIHSAIDIRVSKLGAQQRDLTSDELAIIEMRRNEILAAFDTGVPSVDLAESIEDFVAILRSLTLDTNNVELLSDLEFALLARGQLQQFEIGPRGLAGVTDVLEANGDLSPSAADELRAQLTAIETAYGDGEFDTAATLLAEFVELIESRVGTDVSDFGADLLLEYAAYLDSFGATGSFSDDLSLLDDIQPTLSVVTDQTTTEGATLNIAGIGTFSDPGFDNPLDENGDAIETFAYSINWGDGTAADVGVATVNSPGSFLELTQGSFNGTHVYVDDGTYSVAVTVTDENGSSDTKTFQVTVENVAPAVDDATFEVVENAPTGTTVGTVTATDPGDDTISYAITAGNELGAFAINSVTGEITVDDTMILDFETNHSFSVEITVTDGEGGAGTAQVVVDLLNQASVTGIVFVDANGNSQFDANEMGIDGVTVHLLDETGSVLESTVTADGGFYLFEDLDPGTYRVREVQPSGMDDGAEQLGSLGGIVVDDDVMQLTLNRTDAADYNFAEVGQMVGSSGAAFGVDDNVDLTIMQLLLATNAMTDLPDAQNGFADIYDTNGDGEIDSTEAALRALANDIFSLINEQGDP